ncbi:MAG: PilZ domain-containing protein [Myxococcota bacterium]|nr:PilZ domain-containing protein [Myxococcota bacterium]
MPHPSNLGLPCLLPVQIERPDGTPCRGFVTRLSETTACVSSEPELREGESVILAVHRPSDDTPVTLDGRVLALLDEGGLWRGRSAALIELDTPIDANFLGSPPPSADISQIPLRRGSEPRKQAPYHPDSLPSSKLRTGLGRRRRGAVTRSPASAPSLTPTPAKDSPVTEPLAVESTPQLAPEPLALHQAAAINSAELLPPDPETLGAPAAPAAPPPVHTTEEHIRALTDSDINIAEVSRPTLSQVSGTGPGGDDDPLYLPDGSEALPGQPPASPDSMDEIEAIDPADAPAESSPPPVHATQSFWDDDSWTDGSLDSRMDQSLIPRAARIPSGIPVSLWARGQRLGATALNFSREGMFLAYDGEPPSRGSTVRVEFTLRDEDEGGAIRFNAEVRWHRSDRPGGDLPDGFGIQIHDFDTEDDAKHYSKLLLILLAISEPQGQTGS